MNSFNQQAFNEFILREQIVGLFPEPRKLKSGRISHWYVNWRNAAEDVSTIDELTEHIIAFIKSHGLYPDCIYGVPEGATKTALIATFKYATKFAPEFGRGSHTLAMGRAQPKEHGDPKDKYFVGIPRGKVIALEDVTTTGESLLKTLETLRGLDAKVIAAIGLTNRMERRDDGKSVKEAVEALGVPYLQMSNGPDLLKLMYARRLLPAGIKTAIEEEFERYGVEKLKF